MSRRKPKNKQVVLFFGVIIIAAALIIIFIQTSTTNESAAPVSKSTAIDPQKMEGRWLRPDGGYVLELNNIQADGSLAAAYFNPRPINVSEARWRWNSSHLQVFVEFDDVNYSGSNYKLIYLPEQDRMVGNYFQAVMQQNFEVEFVRQAK